jgi:DNA-directed RNA polymerase alpha subunit
MEIKESKEGKLKVIFQKQAGGLPADLDLVVQHVHATALCNALRAVLLTLVPSLAIDAVKTIHNSTHWRNDRLEERLSLMHVNSSSVDDVVAPEQCDCGTDFCKACAVEIELQVKNDTQDKMYFTNAQFKSWSPGFSSAKPIPIVEAPPGGLLHLKALVRRGTPAQHAKWHAVSNVALPAFPVIRIDEAEEKKLTPDERLRLAKSCPFDVFDVEDLGKKLTVGRLQNCKMCNDCVVEAKELKKVGLITVEEDAGKTGFHIGSLGKMAPASALLRAIRILRQKNRLVLNALL